MAEGIHMNRSLLFLAGLGLSMFFQTLALADTLLIENVTLLSPEQPQPLGNRYVLVRDGRIATVSATPITAPAGARRLDGTGKYLTPGLTDAHVHVSQAIGLTPGSQDPAITALEQQFFAQQPRSYLYFGVTQLLDPSNLKEKVDEFAAQPRHPDIFRCGAAPVVDGYPLVFVPAAIRHQIFNDYIFEPANAKDHPLPAGAKMADHTPEAVVARIAASGARCVKVFIEDGFGDATDWPMISAETLQRVRAAATRHHLFLAAHANALGMQRRAIAAKADIIMHGVWNWDALDREQGLPQEIMDHLRTIHDKGIGYQATLRVLPGVTDLLDPALLDDPVYRKVVPPALLAWYHTEPAQWFKHEVFGPNVNAAAVVAGVHAANEHWATEDKGLRALRYLYELGQPMLLGSDTPSAPTYGNQPGYDTFKEMRLMSQAGIPLSAIFAAGTINNARRIGLDKDYGTIEPGKIANLLLLDGNPLADVEAWSKIDKVILRGEAIDRETLAADAKPVGH
jgi:imidazolonepropionase-like amidohydrolase